MDASKSSPSWAAGQTIWQALKRTPGLIAGGAVDVANLAMGALVGKGLEGLSAKPVGGGEWINEKFGMPASKDAFQQGTEAALSMLSPSGMAKAMIFPAAAIGAKLKDVRAAQQLIKSGKANEAYATYKMYEDPVTGEVLKVIPDTGASLNTSNPALDITQPWFSFSGPEVPISVSMDLLARQPLSAVLDHPAAYAAMPALKNVDVTRRFRDSKGNIQYPAENSGTSFTTTAGKPEISIGQHIRSAQISNPVDELIQTLLHEGQHVVQDAYSMPKGGNYKQFLAEPERVGQALRELQRLEKEGKVATGYATDVLKKVFNESFDLYQSIPGEVQARLVELQRATKDYTTHPLDLMKSMGVDASTMQRATTRPQLDLHPDVQRILDIYAPKAKP
jgi:hypothetical protein